MLWEVTYQHILFGSSISLALINLHLNLNMEVDYWFSELVHYNIGVIQNVVEICFK